MNMQEFMGIFSKLTQLEKDILQKLYDNKRMSARELAEHFRIDEAEILKAMDTYREHGLIKVVQK